MPYPMPKARSTCAVLSILNVLMCSIGTVRADSWVDPSWRHMLDSSDVVALIEYETQGKFRAEARILEVYHGNTPVGKRIWVSGFSNRYGPIDEVRKGDRFIVFLYTIVHRQSDSAYWEERVARGDIGREYLEAVKAGDAYGVASPTSGDSRVKGNTVQYDLIQTSYYSKQPYRSLPELKRFLTAYYTGRGKAGLVEALRSKLRKGRPTEEHAQALLMLELLRECALDNSYDRFITASVPDVRHALAKMAGCSSDPEREHVLLALLKDEHSIVQGEVVRQMRSLSPEVVGPALLAQLPTANPSNYGPSNIMDPVMNTVSGGQAQIVETLGDIRYEPAIGALVALLDNDDPDTFELVSDALRKIGSQAHVAYMRKYLRSGKTKNVFNISMEMVKDSLIECIPDVMHFIHTHDRTAHPDHAVTVSRCCGLGYFRSDTVTAFMRYDFHYLLDSVPSQAYEPIDNKKDWVREYVNTFIAQRDSTIREGLYDFMYDYFAFDHRFYLDTTLFTMKKHLQDSIAGSVRRSFTEDEVADLQVIVYLSRDDGPVRIIDHTILVEVPAMDRLASMDELFQERGFDTSHLWPRYRGNSHFHAKRRPEEFNNLLMRAFIDYIKAFPTQRDAAVFRALRREGVARTDWERTRLDAVIEELEAATR
jgi:hypothetical protein